MEWIPAFLVTYIVFVFSTTFHEAAHALIAYRGGDSTAHASGHLTLDPTPHIKRSPFGMVIVPLLSFIQGGYMIGWASVPYDPTWGARHPRRAALMSLAGPAANFFLFLVAFFALRALVSSGVFHLGGPGPQLGLVWLSEGTAANSALGAVAFALSKLFELNLLLGLFNLLPVPPLDGAGVAEGLSPSTFGRLYARLREVPMFELLALLIAAQLFHYIAAPAWRLAIAAFV